MAERHPDRLAALVALIDKRLSELGITDAEACRRGEIRKDSIRDIRRGSEPRAPKIKGLAIGLEIDEKEIWDLIPTQRPGASPAITISQKLHHPLDENVTGRLGSGPLDLQLFKQGQAGMDGMTVDVPITMVHRPQPLVGRQEAYAIHVPDDLNAPIIRAGRVAYVDPSRPAAAGEMARIFPLNKDAFFGVLESRTADTITVRVISEAAPRVFGATEIGRIERVVGFMTIDI